MQFKSTLRNLRYHESLWGTKSRLSDEEIAKRKYFQNDHSLGSGVAAEREQVYMKDFFMAPLPSKLFEEAGGYDDDDDAPETDPDKKSPKDVKQLLLRTMATEVVMHRSLDGEVAVVQSDFQWFATGIAHTSIFAVMRFMGFSEEWLRFFKKALEPPMNMLDGQPARVRKRGLPMAHIFEKFLGELVLFFMDLAVSQNSEMLLYRFHDDLWLAGSPSKCAAAWKTMTEFASVMGLEFNKAKTGSVYLTEGERSKDPKVVEALPEGPVVMNFLVLDPGSGSWMINQEHVQQHVKQLQKQLDGSKSVLQWIRTWNSWYVSCKTNLFYSPLQCSPIATKCFVECTC